MPPVDALVWQVSEAPPRAQEQAATRHPCLCLCFLPGAVLRFAQASRSPSLEPSLRRSASSLHVHHDSDNDDSLFGGGADIDLDEVLAAIVKARLDAFRHRRLVISVPSNGLSYLCCQGPIRPLSDSQPRQSHSDASQSSRSRFVWVNYMQGCLTPSHPSRSDLMPMC